MCASSVLSLLVRKHEAKPLVAPRPSAGLILNSHVQICSLSSCPRTSDPYPLTSPLPWGLHIRDCQRALNLGFECQIVNCRLHVGTLGPQLVVLFQEAGEPREPAACLSDINQAVGTSLRPPSRLTPLLGQMPFLLVCCGDGSWTRPLPHSSHHDGL